MFNSHQIQQRFGHHTATIEGPNLKEPQHQRIREMFVELAAELDDIVLDSDGKKKAFEELETASMWFHKSLAHDR